ncbi:unnamed protein product [Caenorhabditis auriculariae]|uniref:Uncharacterized protein n=1 Tax=Caenorhabditis auriculariae TaxID=2777116 RepID=A0A8S1HBX8_9PELO|nr:unnamed protein product [Caenorhabditis auriculariae]
MIKSSTITMIGNVTSLSVDNLVEIVHKGPDTLLYIACGVIVILLIVSIVSTIIALKLYLWRHKKDLVLASFEEMEDLNRVIDLYKIRKCRLRANRRATRGVKKAKMYPQLKKIDTKKPKDDKKVAGEKKEKESEAKENEKETTTHGHTHPKFCRRAARPSTQRNSGMSFGEIPSPDTQTILILN